MMSTDRALGSLANYQSSLGFHFIWYFHIIFWSCSFPSQSFPTSPPLHLLTSPPTQLWVSSPFLSLLKQKTREKERENQNQLETGKTKHISTKKKPWSLFCVGLPWSVGEKRGCFLSPVLLSSSSPSSAAAAASSILAVVRTEFRDLRIPPSYIRSLSLDITIFITFYSSSFTVCICLGSEDNLQDLVLLF